jgi:GNAT acetyltransferase-like protein
VKRATATAELLEDRGEAVVGEDFFRSRPFLDAEGVTHTLRIASAEGELLAPLIVREIGGGPERDAISPYGYPGVVAAAEIDHTAGGSKSVAQIDPGRVDFTATGLVSAFIRHRLDSTPLGGATERSTVLLADPALPPKSRPSDRNRINKNLRRGYQVRVIPGPRTAATDRAGFLGAYEQTMRRAGAAPRYFFGAAYFDRILESEQSWLALALDPDGEIGAASIAVRSDGFLHYYLSGSTDATLRDSPMKNVLASLTALSAELALPLNLGGGIAPGDRLEEFKRGFANREQVWLTSEVVCDADAYARLSAGQGAGSFFPAYRVS